MLFCIAKTLFIFEMTSFSFALICSIIKYIDWYYKRFRFLRPLSIAFSRLNRIIIFTSAFQEPYKCLTSTLQMHYMCLTKCLTNALRMPYKCLTNALQMPYKCLAIELLMDSAKYEDHIKII